MVIAKAPYKVTEIYTALVLGLLPLWTGFGSYGAITGAKYRFFLCLSFCYLALMALCTIAKAAKRQLKEDKRAGIECLFFGLFLLWALVSCLRSPYNAFLGQGRREGFLTLALYVLCFVCTALYGRLRLYHLFVLGAAVTINAVIAFLQLMGLDPLDLFPRGLNYYDAGIHYAGSFLGTLGNTNVLSAFLTIALPLLIGGAAAFSHSPASKALLIPIFAAGALMVWTEAASGTLAMICCAVFMFPFVMAKPERRQKWALPLASGILGAAFGEFSFFRAQGFSFCPTFMGIVFFIFAVISLLICLLASGEYKITTARLNLFYLAVLILAAALLYFVPFTQGALREAHLILHGESEPTFGSSRLRIWKRALALIAERPLFGSGPDTFIKRVGFEFSRFIEETGQLRQVQIDCAHNDYLNIAANCGLGALVFYLLALGTVIIKAIKNHQNAVVLALLAAIVAYSVQLAFTFSVCSVSPVFYLVLGLAGSETNHICKTPDLK